MSRSLLNITLRLPDERVLTGRGRNIHTAIERIYNEGADNSDRRRVILVENLKRGHVKEGEHRYQGTFHALVFSIYGDPMQDEGPVEVEVQER